jgi:hypothetical protein
MMNRRTFLKAVPAYTVLAGSASGFAQTEQIGTTSGSAEQLQPITLVEPQTDGGKSVLAALKERKTIRNVSSEKLPPQMLSNLLWAAGPAEQRHRPATRRKSTFISPCPKASISTKLYRIV